MLLRTSFIFLASVLTAGSILVGTASPALAATQIQFVVER